MAKETKEIKYVDTVKASDEEKLAAGWVPVTLPIGEGMTAPMYVACPKKHNPSKRWELHIKRGKEVLVPPEVAKQIKRAQEQELKAYETLLAMQKQAEDM